MSNAIFTEERILRKYFSEQIQEDFDTASIEYVIGVSKTYGYVHFRAQLLLKEAFLKYAESDMKKILDKTSKFLNYFK